jgi:AAA domain
MTQKPNDKFKLLTVGGLAELPDPDWLIEGMVPVRGFVNLYGPPKSGKSFIALDWGLSIAIGVPWLGHQVRTGPVVYVYAETPSDLKARVPAWCMAHDVSPLEFLMLPARVNITDAGERDGLVRLIEQRGVTPALVIIDTLAKCSGATDEQNNTEMGRFVDACESLRDRFDCAVMVVHHSGKDIAAGSRGASAIPAAIDAQFQVTRKGRKGKVKLINEHQRSGAEHADLWLALVPCEKALLVEKTTAPGKDGGTTPKEPTDRDKVIAALAQHMPEGISDSAWKDAAMQAGVAERTFARRKKDLIEEGLVKRQGAMWLLGAEEVPKDDVTPYACARNSASATIH